MAPDDSHPPPSDQPSETEPPIPLGERLRAIYGENLDPEVSLGDGGNVGPESPNPAGAAEPKSKLIERLRAQGPRGTRYSFLGELGRGGMGAVLSVWDGELRRKLAMKVILGRSGSGDEHAAKGHSDTHSVDPRTLGRFLEEAQITGQLDHPGIVPVHEVGIDSTGRVYFTMRLVRGEDLRAVFGHVLTGHDGWNQVRALNVLLRVCEAVAFAHSKEVIHRDLKPANVMVGRFGEVVVMDWGLARVLGREDRHDLRLQPAPSSGPSLVRTERRETESDTPDSPLLTMDGDVVGTPSYMPPEQARGELERLGPHSDVYAIGAMLYQLLTGLMPYQPQGARVSARTILAAVLQGPPLAIESLAPRTPPELVAICEKAMAREIDARYPTTEALAADLRAYLEGRVVAAYETGTWAETRKWVLRNKALAGSLAAAVLAIVMGLVAFGLKTREAQAATRRAERSAEAEREAKVASEAAATLAKEAAKRADNLRADAVARADALWTIQEVAEFARESSDLEFAYALQRSGVDWWLETARRLVNGRAADEAAGIARRPGLADHQRLLAEVRLSATPPTAAELDPEGQRRTWSFVDREKRWWNEQLTTLEANLVLLRDRIAIAERCATSPEARKSWAEARAAIRVHPKYAGLELGPQLFLQPLGPDPESGLWEFAHLLTGEPAVRREDRRLVLKDETGLVFVLLPGGRVPVEDGEEPGPLNEVDLVPFLLSKYEMTQGQWTRISAGWTGRYWNERGPLHPADSVSWDDCQTHLGALPGWVGLPSEAQWEYGCRAETRTPWWTGVDAASLGGVARLDVEWEDGPLAVGSLRANPFGLHDVHGNLWEWCQDPYDENLSPRPRDGLRNELRSAARVSRGGSFDDTASFARSAIRFDYTSEGRAFFLGLRPFQGITP